jgi:hypothetical protein
MLGNWLPGWLGMGQFAQVGAAVGASGVLQAPPRQRAKASAGTRDIRAVAPRDAAWLWAPIKMPLKVPYQRM